MVVVVGCCLLTFKKNQGEQTKRSKYLRRLSLAFNGRRPTQRRVVHFLFVWAKCADKESHIPAAINDTRNRGAFLQKTTPDTHMDDRQTPRHQAHTHTHTCNKNACVVLWLHTWSASFYALPTTTQPGGCINAFGIVLDKKNCGFAKLTSSKSGASYI